MLGHVSCTDVGPTSPPYFNLPQSLSLSLSLSRAMASMSISCPKFSPVTRRGLHIFVPQAKPSLLAGSAFQGHRKLHIVKAKVHEVIVESSKPSPAVTSNTETQPLKGNEESMVEAAVVDSEISAFMAEVASLVKLVDSTDITELRLKQKDCEIIIRKKEALPQFALAAPVLMMQPPPAMFSSQPQVSSAGPSPALASCIPSSPAPALPPAKGSKYSLPPLKCPMAGTFYRSPAPGEAPFVKVGDMVKKGQVVCIIEAMKLMNEIEADQSGQVVEILAEDGKPVSFDMPLLVIEP